jgi:hypothetical protein
MKKSNVKKSVIKKFIKQLFCCHLQRENISYWDNDNNHEEWYVSKYKCKRCGKIFNKDFESC